MKGPSSHEGNCGYYEHAGGCVGGRSLTQGKALASAVVVHFTPPPPREILTFSPQLTLCPPFPSEGMNPTDRRKKKKDFPSIGLVFFFLSVVGEGRAQQCWGKAIWHEEFRRQPHPTAHTRNSKGKVACFALTKTTIGEAEFAKSKTGSDSEMGFTAEADCNLITLSVLES